MGEMKIVLNETVKEWDKKIKKIMRNKEKKKKFGLKGF